MAATHYDPGNPDAASSTLRPKLRILVVDDEPNVRGVISAHLNDEGHIVGTAEDGQKGLERFMAAKWDLVLTDRVMPRMGGDDLARAIKRLDPKMPVILVTAFADRPPDPEGMNTPYDLVIRKPFTRDTLRAMISLVRM